MADRRYEERYYDERNDQSRGRPRYGREGRSMEDERSLYWPKREYDRPQARDDDDDRYGSSYRRDQDPYENGSMYGRMYGREPGRAPGRLPQSYGRQDYGRPDYGVQDDGNAFGFARHDQRHDEQRRGWDDERRWGRNSESGMYGGPGYENGPGFPRASMTPACSRPCRGRAARKPGHAASAAMGRRITSAATTASGKMYATGSWTPIRWMPAALPWRFPTGK